MTTLISKNNEKRITVVIVVIIVILALAFAMFKLFSNDEGDKPLGPIDELNYDLNDAYYLRTEFKDQIFESISDFEMSDGTEYLLYMLPQKLTDKELDNIAHMYDPNYEPHTIFWEILDHDDYLKITDGKRVFYDTFTLTTVIVPAEVKERGEQGEEYFAYVFSYFERDSVTPINELVERSIVEANETGEKRPLLISSKDIYDNYMNYFTLWVNQDNN